MLSQGNIKGHILKDLQDLTEGNKVIIKQLMFSSQTMTS